ncbi:MAG: hypothetical protein ACM3ST_11825 [Bdellovibrio bacteriovorus]
MELGPDPGTRGPSGAAGRGAADREAERVPTWKASLTLGYSITDTFESGAAGPNAVVRVTIPLFDRTSR